MTDNLNQSPLRQQHLDLNARMVPFAGWEMPVQYSGIIPEHMAVREALGVFDISHMGQAFVESDDDAAEKWLNTMLTNNVSKLEIGGGQYSFLLNEEGGVIDDLIIYRQAANKYFLVINASRADEDVEWLRSHLPAGVSLVNSSPEYAGLAVQGPQTESAFASMFAGQSLPDRFFMATLSTDAGDVILCRTGYTGEDGFELFCPVEHAATWWQKCVEAGATPAGLGARDTLRLEKCYPLNGNDLDRQRTPLQAGMGFAVDLTKPNFVGKATLEQQKTDGMEDRLVAIRQLEKSPPPRPGYKVFVGDDCVGELSSGGVSPVLKSGIGLAYIKTGHHKIGTRVEVEIRRKRYPAEIVKKPFV